MVRTLRELSHEIGLHLKQYKNLNGATEIVKKYTGKDWKAYTRRDITDYTRIRVPVKNSIPLDIYVMSWPPCQTSHFHNHSTGGCIMKVLAGRIKEEKIKLPEKRLKTRLMLPEDIGYIDDKIGYHSVSNPSPLRYAYSLHIYHPSGHTTRYFKFPVTTLFRNLPSSLPHKSIQIKNLF